MKTRTRAAQPCLPTSKFKIDGNTGKGCSTPLPVGLNALHEARLVTSLVEYYGWVLCADGNLYNPHGSNAQVEEHVA